MNGSDPSWLAQSPQFLPPVNLVHTLRHEKGFGSRTASGRDLRGIMWVMVLILDWGCAQIWGTGKLIRSHVGYLPIDKPWHLCPRAAPPLNEKWNLVHLRAAGSQLCVFLKLAIFAHWVLLRVALVGENILFCGSRISSECYGLTVMGWMFSGDESL